MTELRYVIDKLSNFSFTWPDISETETFYGTLSKPGLVSPFSFTWPDITETETVNGTSDQNQVCFYHPNVSKTKKLYRDESKNVCREGRECGECRECGEGRECVYYRG